MRSRIMYIENKSGGLTGPCRIGRVTFSKTGATLYYAGRAFQSLTGAGFKANYFDTESGEHFWISGPRRDGADGLYGRITQPEDVDADIADVYWREIRGAALPGPRMTGSLSLLAITDQLPAQIHGRKQGRMAKMLRQRQSQQR